MVRPCRLSNINDKPAFSETYLQYNLILFTYICKFPELYSLRLCLLRENKKFTDINVGFICVCGAPKHKTDMICLGHDWQVLMQNNASPTTGQQNV